MGMPPEDITPEQLFKQLMDCPRPSKVVDFPRNDPVSGKPLSKLRLMSLTQPESEKARADGLAYTKRLIKQKEQDGLDPKDITLETMRGIETDAIAKHILKAACRWENPIKGAKDSPTGVQYPYVFHELEDFAKAQMTLDEVAVLYQKWEVFQHESGPLYTGPMSDDEINAWVERLAMGASRLPLSEISLPALIDLTYSLAMRAYTLAAVLDTHSESLPSTLRSNLGTWGLGTFSFSELPAEAVAIGLVSSSGFDKDGEPLKRRVLSAQDLKAELNLGGEPLSEEETLRLAKKLGRGGIAGVTVGEALPREPDDG
jgi:hypothetical protein